MNLVDRATFNQIFFDAQYRKPNSRAFLTLVSVVNVKLSSTGVVNFLPKDSLLSANTAASATASEATKCFDFNVRFVVPVAPEGPFVPEVKKE